MIVNFNLEKLDKLLLDFYNITGLTVSVWDSDFNQLSYQPKEMPNFCRLIKSNKEGNIRCFKSDKTVCELAKISNKPVTHICHAGLIDTAIPITFNDNILGFIMFGQAADRSDKVKSKLNIEKLSKELSINQSQLEKSFDSMPTYEYDIISSASNIMKLATQFLWLSNMINISNNSLIDSIDDFISANLKEYLSIEILCEKFHISKNKLYHLFKEKFDCSVGAYITEKRINQSKHLLTTTDYSLSEICNLIGIDDYNYFIKVFKKRTGLTPLQYRKKFPLILSE